MTLSQWDCLLKNLGSWQGSFIQISPNGTVLETIPSKTTLEPKDAHQTIHQTITLDYPDGQKERHLEYSSLARSVLFFENGSFSQGSTQLGFNSEFGAELGLIYNNSRRRLVQMYDKNANLAQLTLIPEKLEGASPITSPPLAWSQLEGRWETQVTTIYPDWRSPVSVQTTMIWDMPPLFLGHGIASICPTQTKLGYPFTLELLWLVEPNIYHHLIRAYDAKGGWSSLSLAIAERG